MRIARLTYAVILSGALTWCALILVAPAAISSAGFGPAGSLLYAFFSPLCHQIDSRSFHLFGEPLAVCGRCTAIYFGFLGGALLYPFILKRERGRSRIQPGRMYLILSILPMLIDFTLEATGVYGSSNVIRAVTGAWFGALLPFLIIPGAVEGVSQLIARPKPQAVPPAKGLIDA